MKTCRPVSKKTLSKLLFFCENSLTQSFANFLKVLIVDDDGVRGKTNSEMINNLGHSVELAHDGITALRMAAANRPDAVLLHTHLQGLDECDVAKHLRSDFPEQTPLIIGFSTQTNSLVRRQCVEAGIDLVLESPLNVEAIETVLLFECAKLAVEKKADWKQIGSSNQDSHGLVFGFNPSRDGHQMAPVCSLTNTKTY